MDQTEAAFPILVAEDEATLAEALAECLRQKGFQVDLARDGREALNFLEKRPYPLVITDLVMPEFDGLTVLRAARQRLPEALVVIMTGYASLDSAIGAIREGAHDYLCKPFKLQEIEVMVANAARLIQLHKENQVLLRRLEELTAKLQNLEIMPPGSGSKAHRPKASPAFSPYPLEMTLVEGEGAHRLLVDLERLHRLYKEELLTKDEYRKIKQRLLI